MHQGWVWGESVEIGQADVVMLGECRIERHGRHGPRCQKTVDQTALVLARQSLQQMCGGNLPGAQQGDGELIALDRAKGATVAVGGTLDETDLTVHPTMLTDVTPQMTVLQEEIFAPLLPVMTYDNLDQVIDYITARDKPLAMYIFSPDAANVEKVLSRTSSGGVTVNGVFSHYLENQLPFGGVNQSGTGSYHGYFGFKAFSHERAIYLHQAAA